MSGGAFKNSSNLLARNREIEELEKGVVDLQKALDDMRVRKEDIATALALNEEELETVKAILQEQMVAHTAAQMNVERARQQKNDSDNAFAILMKENKQMDIQASEINAQKQKIVEADEFAKRRSAFNHPTVMYRKSKVLGIGGYGNLRRNQDVDLFGRMLFSGCIAGNIEESLLYFRSNDDLAKRRKSWENTKSYIDTIKKFWKMAIRF